MKLITQEIRQAMPRLYATEDIPAGEKTIIVKYFTPDSNWTWWAVEADAVLPDGAQVSLADAPRDPNAILDVLFFGLVQGFEVEWGYFSLRELFSARGPLGLPIERDLHFGAPTIADALPHLEGRAWTKPEGDDAEA